MFQEQFYYSTDNRKCQVLRGDILAKLLLKLHIYDGRKIVRTYTADVFDIYLGTMEDIAHALRLDKMMTGDLEEIMGAVIGCVDVVRPFLCDMFDGLTMEEARHTRTKNVAEVIQTLFFWFTASMKDAIGESKKKLDQNV